MIEYNVKVDKDGTFWYNKNGKRHRLDGPAVERSDGYKVYYVDGKRHRLDGPAMECSDGTKQYYMNGKLHRLDGPAVEWSDGTKEYWVDGKQYTKEEWEKKVGKTPDLNKLKSCLIQLLECLYV